MTTVKKLVEKKTNNRKIHFITKTEKLPPVIWNITEIPGLYKDSQQHQGVSLTNKNNMTSSHTYLLASDGVSFVCTTVEYRIIRVHLLPL